MIGVFDILTVFWLVLGSLTLLAGLKNYKSCKEKFDVRYSRLSLGINFLLLALIRIFIKSALFGAILSVITSILTLTIACTLSYRKNKI